MAGLVVAVVIAVVGFRPQVGYELGRGLGGWAEMAAEAAFSAACCAAIAFSAAASAAASFWVIASSLLLLAQAESASIGSSMATAPALARHEFPAERLIRYLRKRRSSRMRHRYRSKALTVS
jgi:hypothetical protein